MRALSVGVSPTAAVDTTVYICPTGYYSKFTVMYIHNTGGSTKHITVQWFDASANSTLDILTSYMLGRPACIVNIHYSKSGVIA